MANTFRSKLRTTRRSLIFVGAFTLTITNGAGTGISNYIDAQVANIGVDDTMTVIKANETAALSDGPKPYDPDEKVVSGQQPGTKVIALTQSDLDTIAATPGVTGVNPTRVVSPSYVEYKNKGKFQLQLAAYASPNPLLDAGVKLDESSTAKQILLPSNYIETMGFASAAEAVGKTVVIGITDAAAAEHTVDATVVGVSSATLVGGGGAAINNSLRSKLSELQSTGLPSTAVKTWSSAVASYTPGATDLEITAIKDKLSDRGYSAQTVSDQLGTFKTVINAIILVLNAFAVIALIAAGFGIINTLLMSVQERTREIGLMKAMGMSGGKVFALFSFEAVFIGFLGSAIGSAIGIQEPVSNG
jgi:putative ABC transport system permease protein